MMKRLRNLRISKWLSLGAALLMLSCCPALQAEKATTGIPLLYWNEIYHGEYFINFGDYLSKVLVERIVQGPLKCYLKRTTNPEKKLLAIGSILYFANENDVIWGTGTNGKWPEKKDYLFNNLDVRAVRGPLTRAFLKQTFGIDSPEIYGDPALLFPYFFPEYKRKENPSREYIVIPHYTERKLLPKEGNPHVVHPTEPWDEILEKILDSKLVIASSLHGIILAEAYGIPARMLRLSENELFLKYVDYYFATERPNFACAYSIEEAVEMGGEPPFKCDLKALYETFPFEFWPEIEFVHPDFSSEGAV